MEKSEFEKRFKFENATPFSPEKYLLNTDGFAEALEDFFGKNFSELIELTTDIRIAKKISVSPEYTAFFFKLMLYYIRARAFIRVAVLDLSDELCISITIDRPVELLLRESTDIIRAARNAGYEITPTESGYKLRVKYTEDYRMKVFARSCSVPELLYALNEIFFINIKKSDDQRKNRKK
ncbi:MAG: hypothetical protein J6K44_00395 [Clostridia bacterium]|nr:hypothetical protein [Clostridia bacterium]MBP3582478.1 hypothetical protein [Clostridia bacterium]